MPTLLSVAGTLGLLLIGFGCSTEIQADPSAGGGNGNGGEFGPDATPAPSCDEVRPITIREAQPPDLLLVVDKSGSMDDDIGGARKWNTMRDALEATVQDNLATIHFGLMLYPTGDDCNAGSVSTSVGAGSASQVQSSLGQVYPEGGTPTHTSLQSALSYYQGVPENPNGRYVLLATDGEPNCAIASDPSIPSVAQSVTAIQSLKSSGIDTFVLGFGNGVHGNTLQQMAEAGGQSQFFGANSPAELASALATIASAVALPDCSFSLGETPSDPSRLRLFFDQTEIGRSDSHQSGWDYEPSSNSLTVYGLDCQDLQGGQVSEVRVDYGCEGKTID